MKKWFANLLKKEDGFSLVEAIVTVVILGAAVVPISMVFTRTIETTVDTRRQLEANVLVQEYLEHIKSREMTELETIMPGGTRTISGGDDNSAIGLVDLPSNYNLVLSYGISEELEPLALVSPGDEPEPPVPVDAIITIGSGYVDDVTVSSDNLIMPAELPTTTPGGNRIIYIDVDRIGGSSEGNVTISYKSGALEQTYGIVDTFTTSEKAIRFYMGDLTSFGTKIDTKIVVDSNLPSEFSIYIYEDPANTVDAVTEVRSGYVRISRNLRETEAVPGKIVEITAAITNNITGETLATFKTTKFDE